MDNQQVTTNELTKKLNESIPNFMERIQGVVNQRRESGNIVGTLQQQTVMLALENLPPINPYIEFMERYPRLVLPNGQPNENLYGQGENWKLTIDHVTEALLISEAVWYDPTNVNNRKRKKPTPKPLEVHLSEPFPEEEEGITPHYDDNYKIQSLPDMPWSFRHTDEIINKSEPYVAQPPFDRRHWG